MNLRPILPAVCGVGLFVCLCSVASASAAPSLARYRAADTDWVVLTDGRGTAALGGRGGVLCQLGRGSVRIVDMPKGGETEIGVSGAERVRKINGRTTVYSGRRIGFRVERGWWKIRVQGKNIDASAAVHGRLALRGTAGTFSLRDGAARDWPRHRRVFRLG
ncbi:MAG TPA: hypothetical protein VHK22_05655 [Gaiellaceae bacterium]|nr:hypothetical protein [Gaiellaceae bacterium]